MSLERFKKQVLLLHSEQSALDSLSNGFGDSYTVHVATSGSEALTTLGEIRIDVLVTAQELPGMSGLDALREAKKRSPDTIGILLAGDKGQGLEAVVGDQEVFQIVRGSVTPESLCDLIDNATRQSRLMALSDSANDTSADVDGMTGEHIVMETSENGATIISDGTSTLPVLNPAKISAAANVGSRSIDILVLTKDEEFLATIKDSARGMHNVIYANTLPQADAAVRKHKVGVAVIDAAMLGENVEKLTLHLRSGAPRLVSIVAGRRDDGEMLMELINRGKVYRFLLKPVSPGRARLAIEASVKHHLEAPDSAFKTAGGAAPAQPLQPAAATRKDESKKAAQEAARKAADNAARAAATAAAAAMTGAGKNQPVPTITVEPRPAPGSRADGLPSPLGDGLTDAFGGGDTSFTETMTGIVRSVGNSFRSGKDVDSFAASLELPASRSGGSLFASPKLLGMGAAAMLLVVMLGWWLFGGSEPSVPPATTVLETPVVTEPAPDTASPAVAAPAEKPARTAVEESVAADTGADPLLDEARLAATAGQIFNPPGGNAIELYMEAAAAAPANSDVAAELAAVIDQALRMAESALLEKRTDDASAALLRVGMADPDNDRLPFLNAQLTQLLLRDALDNAREAIRESRFEDAAAALSGARALNVDDAAEIELVADELNSALSEQRIDEVVAKANARLDAGMLIAPSNDNARYYYELALSSDPQNAAARQGLTVVASKLVLQARAQIDNGDFAAADVLLADARRLDPASTELSDAADALQSARDRVEQQRLAAEQQAADKKAAAERAATQKLAEERAAAERAEAERVAAERKAEAAQAAAAASEDASDTPLQAVQANAAPAKVAASGSTALKTAIPAADSVPARNSARVSTNPASADPVSVSSLARTKYVAPKYPRSAQRRSLSGFVDVVFTVDIDGTVKDVQVKGSEPGDTFVDSATNAVEGWEFEPIIENGAAVEKRAAVRMMFAIE